MSEQDNTDKGVAAIGSMIVLKGTKFKSCCRHTTKHVSIISITMQRNDCRNMHASGP